MTPERQSTLGTLQNNSEERDFDPIANAAPLRPPRYDDAIPWGIPRDEFDLTTVWAQSQTNFDAANTSVSSPTIRWVTGGDLNQYLNAHGDTVFTVPDSYSTFDDEWTLYFGTFDTRGQAFGYGITAERLEQALRVLTGGGRYKARKYTVIGCNDMPFVLTGPEGTLLCSLAPVDTLPEHVEIPMTTIPIDPQSTDEEDSLPGDLQPDDNHVTLEVPDDHPKIKNGVRTLLSAIDWLPRAFGATPSVVSLAYGSGYYYSFSPSDDDEEYRISVQELVELGQLQGYEKAVTELFATLANCDHNLEAPEQPYERGDVVSADTLAALEHSAKVLGYRPVIMEHEPHQPTVVGLSIGFVEINPNRPRVRIRHVMQRIGTLSTSPDRLPTQYTDIPTATRQRLPEYITSHV